MRKFVLMALVAAFLIAAGVAGAVISTEKSSTSTASAATLVNYGQTTVLSSDDNGNANMVLAQPVTPDQSGAAVSLSFYVTTAAGNITLGIYSDNNGKPGSLIGTTADTAAVSGWNTLPITGPPPIYAGQTYWIAYEPSDNNLGFKKTGTSQTSYYFTQPSYGLLPNSFSTSTSTTTSQWSFYVSVDTSQTPNPLPTTTTTPPVSTPAPHIATYACQTGGSTDVSTGNVTFDVCATVTSYVDAFLRELQAGSLWASWIKSNPGELTRLKNYLADTTTQPIWNGSLPGGYPMSTATGAAFQAVISICKIVNCNIHALPPKTTATFPDKTAPSTPSNFTATTASTPQ